MHRQGHPVARCTVARLMRAAGLRGVSRGKGPRTTVPGSGPDTRPDLVDRAFTATAPNQLWVADIERHEALLNRAVVKGHRGRSVAAGR
jgi:putative transposase